MDAPDGTPGSGWDVRFDTPEREALNLPPGPLDFGPGPSAGQKPKSEETRPSTGSYGKLEGGDRARSSARGEASGSGSGSPDENVNKRSNPPSPRERLPASPEAARARDESDISTPSSPLPHQLPCRVRAEAARRARREAEAAGRDHRKSIESGHGERPRRGTASELCDVVARRRVVVAADALVARALEENRQRRGRGLGRALGGRDAADASDGTRATRGDALVASLRADAGTAP
jgi:hypothetical protein